MKKKWLALVLVVVMVLGSLTACGDKKDDTVKKGTGTEKKEVELVPEDTGKVLNIYCWNDEFQTRVKDFYPDYDTKTNKIGDVKVNWVINPNQDNVYQNKLDAALKKQDSASADDKIDMFLIEADYADKYINTDYSLQIQTLGVTDEDMAQQYQYTKDVVTDKNGVLKGISWQGCPGGFIYRRSIAKEVFGADDPESVQALVADWDTFNSTAKTLNEKSNGKYFMLSGYDDSYRVFSNNMAAKWVDDSKKIVIDDNIKAWVDQTKDFTDKGYNQKSILWDPTWAKGMGKSGKVFGYFMPAWGISFTMAGNSLETPVDKGGKEEKGNGAYGDYGLVLGPQSFNWGGTWVCACKGTDNGRLVGDIMKKLTCDKGIMTEIVKKNQDFVNNKEAIADLTAAKTPSAFLGGQCLVEVLGQAADQIDMSKITPYDQGLNEEFQNAMHDYFAGTVDYDKALANFYEKALVKYPALQK